MSKRAEFEQERAGDDQEITIDERVQPFIDFQNSHQRGLKTLDDLRDALVLSDEALEILDPESNLDDVYRHRVVAFEDWRKLVVAQFYNSPANVENLRRSLGGTTAESEADLFSNQESRQQAGEQLVDYLRSDLLNTGCARVEIRNDQYQTILEGHGRDGRMLTIITIQYLANDPDGAVWVDMRRTLPSGATSDSPRIAIYPQKPVELFMRLLARIAENPQKPVYSPEEIQQYLRPLLAQAKPGQQEKLIHAYVSPHSELIGPINNRYYVCQITHHPRELFLSANQPWSGSCIGCDSADSEFRRAILGVVGDPTVSVVQVFKITVEEALSLTGNSLTTNSPLRRLLKDDFVPPSPSMVRRYMYLGTFLNEVRSEVRDPQENESSNAENAGANSKNPVIVCDRLRIAPDEIRDVLSTLVREVMQSYCEKIAEYLDVPLELLIPKAIPREEEGIVFPNTKVCPGPYGHMADFVSNGIQHYPYTFYARPMENIGK